MLSPEAPFRHLTAFHNASIVVPVIPDNSLLAAASLLSLAGDAGILVSFLLHKEARRRDTTRLITALAAADLIGQFPVVGSLPLPGAPAVWEWGGPWCVLQAAGNWYSASASWLWTMAFAHHIAAGMDQSSGHFRFFRPLPEWQYHAICWGLPAVAIGAALGDGLLGRSDDSSDFCTFKNSSSSMPFFTLLWIALLYNALVFFVVHRGMRSGLSANAAISDPHAVLELRRRVDALGGRFLLYIATFLVTQLPCAMRHVLVAVLGPPHLWCKPIWMWTALCLLVDFLTPLHGFLNGLVYGCHARGFERCCGLHGGDADGGVLALSAGRCWKGRWRGGCWWMRWRHTRASTDLFESDEQDCASMSRPLVAGGSDRSLSGRGGVGGGGGGGGGAGRGRSVAVAVHEAV